MSADERTPQRLRALANGWDEPGDVVKLAADAAHEIERVRAEVAGWIASRRKELSKQGIRGGHLHHDLALLEQIMEGTDGK